MTKRQYVTINGTKLYLDGDGKPVTGRGVHLHTNLISVLDLEVETEGPRFEDIEPGIYSPHANIHNVIVKKNEAGRWTNAEGYDLRLETSSRLVEWHNDGKLFRLNKGEATNA